LTRWVNPEGRDHDVYVVTSGRGGEEWKSLSRPAAIAAAHCLAGVSLFAWNEGVLAGLISDAALPDAIGQCLRLRHTANPGLKDGRCAYLADRSDVQLIENVLPRLIADPGSASQNERYSTVSASRRSGGRNRVQWVKGQLGLLSAASAKE
jgi:hypothetical protein